jgi:hypothetical protein
LLLVVYPASCFHYGCRLTNYLRTASKIVTKLSVPIESAIRQGGAAAMGLAGSYEVVVGYMDPLASLFICLSSDDGLIEKGLRSVRDVLPHAVQIARG